MHIYVVTVANKSDGYYEILKKSCIRNGCTLITLGFGEKWGGFIWKYKKMREFLKTLNPTDIVIFVDGFDVIMVDHIDNFITCYNKFNKSIILSITNDLEIIKYFAKKMFNTIKYNGSEYWICSGLYVGKAADLTQMFDLMNIDSTNLNDDQLLLTKFVNENPKFSNEKIALDTKMELFTNVARPEIKDWIIKNTQSPLKLTYKNGKIINEFNKSTIFLHGPGSINLKPYISQLGYTDIPDISTYSNSRVGFYSNLFIENLTSEDWLTYICCFLIFIFVIILIILINKSRSRKKTKKSNMRITSNMWD
jgi:hypothetical protein